MGFRFGRAQPNPRFGRRTTAFSTGQSTTTTFRCVEQAGKSITFNITPSNTKFGPKQWLAKFHLTSVPTALKLDGKALPKTSWAFDKTTATLTVKMTGQKAAHSLSVALDGSIHPRAKAPQVDAPPIGESESAIAARQIPQFLPAPKLPGRIEAANFDKGGEGLAFHIISPDKKAIYRQDGVPIIASSDGGGGYAIPGLKATEFLAYTLDAGDGGWFAVNARVSPTIGGKLLVQRNHFQTITTLQMPASTGTKWLNVAGQSLFYLPPGEQILTMRVAEAGFQLGNFTFTKLKDASVTVEAETGVLTGVGLDTDHPGYGGTGFVAGISNKAASVKIPVNVPKDGTYLVAVRYANGANNAEPALKIGDDKSATIVLPPTSDWNGYEEAGALLELKAGPTEITVSGNDTGVVNLDQLKLIPMQSSSPMP